MTVLTSAAGMIAAEILKHEDRRTRQKKERDIEGGYGHPEIDKQTERKREAETWTIDNQRERERNR